jgi:hypothetical protein
MDQELREYLAGMEGRLGGRIDDTNRSMAAMESRLRDETGRSLAAMEGRLDGRIDDTNRSLAAMEARLLDRMAETARDMQTELLRGIAAYAESTSIRMRKLEADQSNLDAALSGRMAVMEKRLFEIEQRLGGMTH